MITSKYFHRDAGDTDNDSTITMEGNINNGNLILI